MVMMSNRFEFVAVYLLIAVWQIPASFQDTIAIEEDRVVVNNAGARVLSGWEAQPGQHPWQLALRLTSPQGSVLGCGGVLVHASWGLTAAHCTANRVTIVVLAGLVNLTSPRFMTETTEFYSHPTYDVSRPTEAQPNDISIFKIMRPIPLTPYTGPIRMQSSEDKFRDYSDELVYTSGFGRLHSDGTSVEVLHWVFLRAISNEQCAEDYGDVITSSSICAGPYNVSSQSVCYGDSGGPLVLQAEDETPTLLGITSFVMGGDYGCHSGFPSAFTRPGPHHAWFTFVTGINFDTTDEISTEPTTTETTVMTDPTTTTVDPTIYSTADPTTYSTVDPTSYSTADPTTYSTVDPTTYSITDPTTYSTVDPTTYSTVDPTTYSTADPTTYSTTQPTTYFTINPSTDSTLDPNPDFTTDHNTDFTTDPTTHSTLVDTSAERASEEDLSELSSEESNEDLGHTSSLRKSFKLVVKVSVDVFKKVLRE